MTFTKKKLNAAIAGAAVAVSPAAFSIVDMDDAANVGMLVANETIIDPVAGVALVSTGADAFTLGGTLNANRIPANSGLRVTVTLSSGTFAAAPALDITNAVTNASTGTGGNICDSGDDATTNDDPCPDFVILTGGGTADSTVTFNTPAAASFALDGGSHFVMDLGAGGLNVKDQSAITATVNVAIADNFGATDLGTRAVPYVRFGPVAALAADATNAETTGRIDAGSSSLFLAGTSAVNTINVGGFRLAQDLTGSTAAGTIPVSRTGTAIATNNVASNARATINAANGFSAFSQGTAGGTVTSAGNACAFSTADATIATCTAYATDGNGDEAGQNDVVLTTLTGTSQTVAIAETTLTASVATTAAAATVFSTANVDGTVNLLSLARNGSSARLNFALTPGGNFPMFLRVTNPSAVAGPVTLTLTNDDGVTSTAIDISAIEGAPAGELAAGASTALLNIDDVMAAVQAADATFALGASNKLRVDVVAEFGSNASITQAASTSTSTVAGSPAIAKLSVQAGSAFTIAAVAAVADSTVTVTTPALVQDTGSTGVILSAFTVSSDGTTFAMLTDASD